MRIRPDVLKCVCFIGVQKADGTFILLGSAFSLGQRYLEKAPESRVTDLAWVTARHVIDRAESLGCTKIFLRLNNRAGGFNWHETQISAWRLADEAPPCDIAFYSGGVPSWADHLSIPPAMVLTPSLLQELEFGPTDEVFVVGLFHHRAGHNRNVPIIRTGSIASIADDELIGTAMGEMPLYLIEGRSIGGLSGSPVFVTRGYQRMFKKFGVDVEGEGSPDAYLLGVIHGHFDTSASAIDDAVDDAGGLGRNQINTGIAMVTPVFRLMKFLNASYPKPLAIGPVANFGDIGWPKFQIPGGEGPGERSSCGEDPGQ